MRKLKKAIIGVLASAMLMGAMTGCGKAASDDITVISREDGSGTRGAFIELFGIEEKDADGNKIDNTISTADITNSTSVMMTSVADDEAAIGYISLGSLDDSVKALKIDGAEATADNISNGSYKVSRPFNIATKGTPNEVTQDFINFILSEDGQKVVESNCSRPIRSTWSTPRVPSASSVRFSPARRSASSTSCRRVRAIR